MLLLKQYVELLDQALDEAADEREELILAFEKEMQEVDSAHVAREQQMLADFETQLREVHKTHKQAIDDKEQQYQVHNSVHKTH